MWSSVDAGSEVTPVNMNQLTAAVIGPRNSGASEDWFCLGRR
jgi:hypothetical protein